MKLNVGCGAVLAPGFVNMDVVFTKKQMKEIYKRRGQKFPSNTEYVQGSVTDMPFADNSAEYLESVDMIEHLPMRALTKAFSEMYRVTAKGGKVCVFTTNFDDVAKLWLETSEEFNKKLLSGEDISEMFDSSHRLDDDYGWKEIMKKKLNMVMSIVYGNQFHEGEYHRAAFSPYIMHVYLRQAGFEHDGITIKTYERGQRMPALQAYDLAENNIETDKDDNKALITDVIVAEAIKS